MFWNIFLFEVKYWLRQPMPWIFLIINALFVFGAMSSDNISIGGAVGNVLRNSPFTVQNFYFAFSLITGLLMTTSFVQGAALRDFQSGTYQIIFSSPIRKRDYLMGRFFGAILVAIIPAFGIAIGEVFSHTLAPLFGWMPIERFGAFPLQAHINGFFAATIPNVLFVGAIIFGIASVTRSTMLSFIGALLLLVGYGVTSSLIRDFQNDTIVALSDPFGGRAFSMTTKYWAVAERNSLSVPFYQGLLGLNRLLWIMIGLGIATFSFWKFDFTEKRGWTLFRSKKKDKEIPEPERSIFENPVPLPAVQLNFDLKSYWVQLFNQTKVNIKEISGGVAFIVIFFAGILNLGISLYAGGGGYFGVKTLPVTYNIISLIRGTMYLFLLAIVVLYSGQLVWREREAKMNQIQDSMPYPNSISYWSKFLAVIFSAGLIQLVCIGFGIFKQFTSGYYSFDLGQYLFEFLFIDMGMIISLTAMSMMIQSIFNQKYLSFFIFIAFIILNSFVWTALGWSSNLISFDGTPSVTYSDMNRYGYFLEPLFWFRGYWFLIALLLSLVAIVFWVRGTDFEWKSRWVNAKQRFSGSLRTSFFSISALALIVGGWIFYNTRVLNKLVSSDDQEMRQINFEKKYKKFEKIVQPTIIDAEWNIDIFPKERKLNVSGDLILVNYSDVPIDSVHIVSPTDMTSVDISIPNAKRILYDKDGYYSIFRLGKPLLPSDTLKLHFISKFEKPGFENNVSFTSLAENGTFFNQTDVTPMIGYQNGFELSDKNKRKKHGLPERKRMPSLCQSCMKERNKNYIATNAEWVNMRTTISTSSDQIAIAPGTLKKESINGNRRTFFYELDHPSQYFVSFMSAKYEVKREKWNGIDCEVYYDKKHSINVPNMMSSIKKSLKYYTENFGPYNHNQARIIEFPRYANFAQAFPGTMPYSESIGFVQDIDETNGIDMVFYVVAHEMGHQWWAHQVIGAEMQGATFLSESMAQYSALMVMEKEFGRNRMGKFLKYETDRYLRSRGGEQENECSLHKVENQGYIHYQKGTAIMFRLKELIGEKNVNIALKNMVDSFGYKNPPYPTSIDLLDRFYASTPDSIKASVKQMFEEIILWDNRITSAKAEKLSDGKYAVDIEIQSKKMKADSVGNEKPAPLDEWIEIGLLSKPLGDKIEGDVLVLKSIKSASGKYRLISEKEPYQAAIDPLHYLIDRVPNDNIKKLEWK
jgi:ABC-2 type transport system permease protein